jgi:hypothetical protein
MNDVTTSPVEHRHVRRQHEGLHKMHFWKIQPLANKLASGPFSERDGMRYFLASTLLILAQLQYALWWGPRSGWLFHIELLALAGIAWVGISQIWGVNGGRSFVLRAVCLSVPAGVRVFVLSFAFGTLLQHNAATLFDYQTFRNPALAYELVSYAGFIGFSIYFWYLLYSGMAYIARLENHSAAQPN